MAMSRVDIPVETIPGAKTSGTSPGVFWPRYVPVETKNPTCGEFVHSAINNNSDTKIKFFFILLFYWLSDQVALYSIFNKNNQLDLKQTICFLFVQQMIL